MSATMRRTRSTRQRGYWTDQELQHVADEFVRIHQAESALSPSEIYLRAQKAVLPEARHLKAAGRTFGKLYKLIGGRPKGLAATRPPSRKARVLVKMVRWTREEWPLIATEVARLRREYPDLSTSEYLSRAQRAVMPETRRRRHLRSAHTYRLLRQYEVKVPRQRPSAIKSTFEAAPDAPVTSAPPAVTLEMVATEVLAGELVTRLVRATGGIVAFVERLHGRLTAFDLQLDKAGLTVEGLTRASAFAMPAIERTAQADRKVRILVIGCLAGQERLVQFDVEKLGLNGVELRFLPKDASPGRLDVGTAVAVVLWTKFVGHKHEAMLVKQLGRERVYLHSGGLGGIKDRVQEILKALEPGGVLSSRS